MILVLDTAGVTALAPVDQQRRARLRALRERADDFVVPAAVLAEGVLTGNVGFDYHVRRLLEVVDVVAVDEALGFTAGALRQKAIGAGVDPPPSGVDAIVAAVADARAGHDDVQVVTSDAGDLELLASLGAHADRVSLVVV